MFEGPTEDAKFDGVLIGEVDAGIPFADLLFHFRSGCAMIYFALYLNQITPLL